MLRMTDDLAHPLLGTDPKEAKVTGGDAGCGVLVGLCSGLPGMAHLTGPHADFKD